MTIESKMTQMGLTLPNPIAPIANYVPYVISGNQVFISGQISKIGETVIQGRLGEDLSVEEGQRAAQLCGLNIVAQLKSACGSDLTRVRRIIKLGGFVQATPDITGTAIPQIINGCSDLMVALFGDAGRHARFAVSAPSLPLDVAVEIYCIAEIVST